QGGLAAAARAHDAQDFLGANRKVELMERQHGSFEEYLACVFRNDRRAVGCRHSMLMPEPAGGSRRRDGSPILELVRQPLPRGGPAAPFGRRRTPGNSTIYGQPATPLLFRFQSEFRPRTDC